MLGPQRPDVSEGDLSCVTAEGCNGGPASGGIEILGRESIRKCSRGTFSQSLFSDLLEYILASEGLVGLRVGKGSKVAPDELRTVYTRKKGGLAGPTLGKTLDAERCIQWTNSVERGGQFGKRRHPLLAGGQFRERVSLVPSEGIRPMVRAEADAV